MEFGLKKLENKFNVDCSCTDKRWWGSVLLLGKLDVFTFIIMKFTCVGILRYYFYHPASYDNIASIPFYLGKFTHANHVLLPGPGKHSIFFYTTVICLNHRDKWTHDLDKSNNNGCFSFTVVSGPDRDWSGTFPGIILIGKIRKNSHYSLILIIRGYPFPSSWECILYCQSPMWKKTGCNWRELCQ